MKKFTDRRYIIIKSHELIKINFNDFYENSFDTLRFSADGTLTFLKYSINNVPNILEKLNILKTCTHEEMIEELQSPLWEDLEF